MIPIPIILCMVIVGWIFYDKYKKSHTNITPAKKKTATTEKKAEAEPKKEEVKATKSNLIGPLDLMPYFLLPVLVIGISIYFAILNVAHQIGVTAH